MKKEQAFILVGEGPIPAFAYETADRFSKKTGLTCLFVTNTDCPAPPDKPDHSEIFSELTSPAVNIDPEIVALPKEKALKQVRPILIINLGSRIEKSQDWESVPVLNIDLLLGHSRHWFPFLASKLAGDDDSIRITAEITGENTVYNRQGNLFLIKYDYSKCLTQILRAGILLAIDCSNDFLKGRKSVSGYLIRENIGNYDLKFNNLIFQTRINKLKHRYDFFTVGYKWNIGYIEAPIEKVALDRNKSWQVKWFPEFNSIDFIADPFGIINGTDRYVACEIMLKRKGEIALINPSNDIDYILDAGHHLSYPYTFRYEGEWLCIPEQHKSGRVDLYRFNNQNRKLDRMHTLIDGINAVDPSIINYNGKWWLFFTDSNDKGADLRLHIFYADKLEGPWQAHEGNPVKTDISSARPGGHMFIHEGKLYRPSQDSSKTYGGALVINEVTALTPEIFEEREVNRIEPKFLSGPYRAGVHTISSLGDITLVDAKRKIRFPRLFQH